MGAGFGGSQSRTPAPSTVKKKKQEEVGSDLLLPIAEIASVINTCSTIRCTEEDILKPQPAHVQQVYEWFLEFFQNCRRENFEPVVIAVSEELEFSDLHQDSRMLVAAFRKINELMAIVGVDDFGFQDLFKPDPKRLVRILSHVINFYRFVQQTCLEPFQNVANQAQKRKERVDELLDNNDLLQGQIKDLRQQQKENEPLIAAAQQFNEQLMNKLRDLKGEQTTLQENLLSAKDNKKAMINTLRELQEQLVSTRQECEKLRPYIVESPEKLQHDIQKRTASLHQEKAEVESLERQCRALQTSGAAFSTIEGEIQTCNKLLEECEAEILKYEHQSSNLARQTDALEKKKTEIRSRKRTEELTRKHLESARERLERGRQQAEEKSKEGKRKMEELHATYKELTFERTENKKEIEKRKIEIEQTEKRMADLRAALEAEVSAAQREYQNAVAHIELYMTKMDQYIT
ncbi:hypothetical protein BJ508DRAFT_325165 [Ascobolus immersus RN42]|uniref:Probable kinetochore protein NUF2 n=1 Tax=Ascobolus immersus RN42 TaxID=1160509 RepID=A0A3N4IDC1_ASCIM|nr:hypothetical protein BJ508DRAFT_325165 [Ascobolus immersus RN42]